jgi:hypothetical protein
VVNIETCGCRNSVQGRRVEDVTVVLELPRMIHRKPPWPTPAELRELIHRQPNGQLG